MKTRIIVASIVTIYNLIGIITLFGLYPDDLFYCDSNIDLLSFTFPIIFFGFAIRFASSGLFLPIAVQIVILAFSLFICDSIVRIIQSKIH